MDLENKLNTMATGSQSSSEAKNTPSSVIPWEYGTNRYASQKGMGAFGSPRNVVMKLNSTGPAQNREAESVIPKLTMVKQNSTFQPFGGNRDVVIKIEDHKERRPVCEASADKATGTFLSKWSIPNPHATNADIGKARGATTEVIGQGRVDRKSQGFLTKLQDTTLLAKPSAQSGVGLFGFNKQRQVTTQVDGLYFTDDEQTKSKTVVPWTTGRVGMQTQSGTGGFLKHRDVVNQTYHDEKKSSTPRKRL